MPRKVMLRECIEKTATWLTILFPVLLIAGTGAADAGLSLIAALFLLHSALTKNWGWLKAGWVRALFIAWAYMMARSAFVPYPKNAFLHAVPFLRFFLFAAALGCWTLRDALTRRRFLHVLTAVIIFTGIDAIVQLMFGYDILLRRFVMQPDLYFRLTGPFAGQILGIMLAWLSFPACLHLLFTQEGALRRDARLPERILFVLIVQAAIVLSDERMALLLTLVGWGLAAFLLPVKRRYPLMFLGMGLLLLILLAVVDPMIYERQVYSILFTFEHWDTSPYGLLLKTDIRMSALNPLFGIGPNQFRTTCPLLYPDVGILAIGSFCNLHPHNIYFEWLIEEGLIGFALFLAFLFFVFRDCFKAWPAGKHDPVFAGFLIAFIFRTWPFLSTTGFFSHWGAPPFWLVLGGLIAYSAEKKAL